MNVHCSSVHNSSNRETSKCPSVDEWVVKQTVGRARVPWKANNRSGLLIDTVGWMGLKGIMLSEKRKPTKVHIVWFHLDSILQ